MEFEAFASRWLGIHDRENIERIKAVSITRSLRKGELLIQGGEVQKWCYFLNYGLFRGFFLDSAGRDLTECFSARPGGTVMSCLGVTEISPIGFEALEDSEVFGVPMALIRTLLEEDTSVVRTYNQILTAALREQWEIKLALCQYDARERYLWFRRTYPALIGRVQNKHIASFLSITPVTLSRLRRTIREEGGEL